jgi:hypothetical protein
MRVDHHLSPSPRGGEGRGEGQRPSTPLGASGALLLVLLACGCGHSDKPDGGSDGGAQWAEGTLELGNASPDGGFQQMPVEVEATPGAQGGFHIPVMYRVNGKAVAGVLFEHRIERTRDAALVSKGTRTFDVTPVSAQESWTTPGAVIIFICPTPVGVSVVGEALTFEVTATKDGELLGKATASAVFRCAPGDSFCESICKG